MSSVKQNKPLLYILEHINCPLSGLYYNIDKCRSEEQKGVLLASAGQSADHR